MALEKPGKLGIFVLLCGQLDFVCFLIVSVILASNIFIYLEMSAVT